jgi:hypothetical protein
MLLSDFYALHVLVGVGGWFLACAMAIHGLELAQHGRVRFWTYSLLCVGAGALAWIDLANENREAREREKQNTTLSLTVGDMKKASDDQRRTIGDLSKQTGSLIDMGTTLAQNVNDMRTEISRQNSIPRGSISQSEVAKSIAGRVAGILTGRAISDEDAKKFVTVLDKEPSKVSVTTIMGDVEAFQFTTRLIELLKKSGWQVDGPNQGVFNAPIAGVILQIKDKDQVPAGANIIAKAFHEIGVSIRGEMNPTLKTSDEISLIVGSKPPQ